MDYRYACCAIYGVLLTSANACCLEILPFFTRLELENGEWNPRYWPPNFGAERDIPPDAKLHHSVEVMHKAGMLEEMPKLGGDGAPLLKDPLVVFRLLMPWKWGK